MSDHTTKTITGAGGAAILLSIVPLILLNALAVWLVWGWYATAIWAAAPVMSLKAAVAAQVFVSTARMLWTRAGKAGDKTAADIIGPAVVNPLLVIAVAWVVYRLVIA